MEKPTNINLRWKSLQMKTAMEKPSNTNRSRKPFITESHDGKSFLYKLGWKSLQIKTVMEKPSNLTAVEKPSNNKHTGKSFKT